MLHRLVTLAALARTVVAEAIRDRILYGLLVFGVGLILLSTVLSDLTLGFRLRIVTDLSLSAIAGAGTLMAILLGITSIARDVERKTALPILAKPIARGEYVLGKYLGVYSTTFLNIGFMIVAATFMISRYRGEPGNPDFAWSAYAGVLALLALRLAVIASIAVFYSTFTSSTVAFIASLGTTIAGYFTSELRFFLEKSESQGVKLLGKTLYYLLPDFSRLDQLSALIYNDPIFGPRTMFAVAYAIGYSTFLLIVGSIIFSRRDLS